MIRQLCNTTFHWPNKELIDILKQSIVSVYLTRIMFRSTILPGGIQMEVDDSDSDRGESEMR